MTGSERPLCDCPEPCACYAEGYAAGKDKAYFEVLANLEGPPHAGDCSCQLKVMALLARTSSGRARMSSCAVSVVMALQRPDLH